MQKIETKHNQLQILYVVMTMAKYYSIKQNDYGMVDLRFWLIIVFLISCN